MDYMKNAEKHYVDGHELSFVRCDKSGNILSPEMLAQMNFTNPTIDRLVTETAGRLGVVPNGDDGFLDGFTS